MTISEILRNSSIEGNVLKLPPQQLERKTYLEVKKALELIGGSWKGGKVSGFVFQQDPTSLVQHIITGHQPNLKKDFQFFETPADLADQMVELLFADSRYFTHSHDVLEPSAGQGALIDAVLRKSPNADIAVFEIMDLNRKILNDKYGDKIYWISSPDNDFLKSRTGDMYDLIIANPPFAKNQDIDHIMHMYANLADGGRMVTLASAHWEFSQNKKETEFRQFLEKVGAVVTKVPEGTFKESGTMISARMIVIDK